MRLVLVTSRAGAMPAVLAVGKITRVHFRFGSERQLSKALRARETCACAGSNREFLRIEVFESRFDVFNVNIFAL